MINKYVDNKENIISRPKPTVLLEYVNKATYIGEQVLNSEGIWAVYYNNSPINLKTHNILVNYPGPKYKKVSFSNSGHAINLCKKLNTMFKTNAFSVVFFREGEKIYP